MSNVADFVAPIRGFYQKTAVEQLLILAWFVEVIQRRAFFDSPHMRQCFRDANLEPPDLSIYLPRLAAKKPPQLVKGNGGYRLAGTIRRSLDAHLSSDPTVTVVTKSLLDLPAKVPNLSEKIFLVEALSCYRVQAFRAAIVMTWNLSYDHFVRWILNDANRLQSMNSAIKNKYPKKIATIAKFEDASELKEFEFIEVARTAGIIDKNTAQILKEKLSRRNIAAHPSTVTVTQHQADDMITDLVVNVILKLQ